MKTIASGRFTINEKIGAGSFGVICRGEETRTKKEVAVKFESAKCKFPQLSYESKLYTIFKNSCNVPRIFWYGSEESNNAMVIELLDSSLEELAARNEKHRLSLKTVLMIADQMISAIQYLHSLNFIHRDIKPDNFMMGKGKNANKLYIIDFGLSKKFRDPKTHQHIKYCENKDLTGTARYASVNALSGVEQSRRDDMEAIGYTLIYLLRGNLPWMGINAMNRRQKFDRIRDAKVNISFEELCKGFPEEFVKYFYEVRKLKFMEKPDYSSYRKLFRNLFIRLGYTYDYAYDWSDCLTNSNTEPNLLLNPLPLPKNNFISIKEYKSMEPFNEKNGGNKPTFSNQEHVNSVEMAATRKDLHIPTKFENNKAKEVPIPSKRSPRGDVKDAKKTIESDSSDVQFEKKIISNTHNKTKKKRAARNKKISFFNHTLNPKMLAEIKVSKNSCQEDDLIHINQNNLQTEVHFSNKIEIPQLSDSSISSEEYFENFGKLLNKTSELICKYSLNEFNKDNNKKPLLPEKKFEYYNNNNSNNINKSGSGLKTSFKQSIYAPRRVMPSYRHSLKVNTMFPNWMNEKFKS